MGEWAFAVLIIGFSVGLYLGSRLTKSNIFANADEQQRLLYRDEFYKVFRLSRHGGIHSDPGGHLDQSPPTDRAREPAPCPYIVTGDEGTSYCRLAAEPAVPESERVVLCHARGERCLGCAHYRGEAPLCMYAEEQAAMPEPVCVVFDGPPSHESGRFVEVEQGGKSVSYGEWREREDGLWELVLPTAPPALPPGFLDHCVSVMRGVIAHCQPKPRTTYDDPTEHHGELALAELEACAYEISGWLEEQPQD